ncbi:MAG: patatin-like phospholipase family protein [Cyclobacteriaceae bacterium]|nr:patatin-like phospholipase family protein [Cyclobacteriaceae bacterium]
MSTTVTLVLSSGGARGYAHIGVIEALEKHGFSIASVTGCSMGSVVGGLYAAGGLPTFKNWACGLDRSDVFKLYDFVFSGQGILRGERVFHEIEQLIPDQNIEDLPILFKAVATDINLQKELIFDHGSLYKALRASSAIPAVVKPAEYDDLELVDGGVLNPLPISLAPRIPGDILVAVDVNANIPFPKNKVTTKEKEEDHTIRSYWSELVKKWFQKDANSSDNNHKKTGFFDLMVKSVDMMQDRITEYTIREYKPDILVSVSRSASGSFDYHKAEKLIKAGHDAFEKSLLIYLNQTHAGRLS